MTPGFPKRDRAPMTTFACHSRHHGIPENVVCGLKHGRLRGVDGTVGPSQCEGSVS